MDGFYIGRYETGNISYVTPVVRRLNRDINNQPWYTGYIRMKNISTNPNIKTSIIWGSLFDEVLEWIIETGDKTRAEVAIDSESWGNYGGTIFTFMNESGTVLTRTSGLVPTGSTERNKANNIYDLAGNLVDCTLEKYITNDGVGDRCGRGMGYNYSANQGGASERSVIRPNGLSRTSSITYNIGFRAFFYIK